MWRATGAAAGSAAPLAEQTVAAAGCWPLWHDRPAYSGTASRTSAPHCHCWGAGALLPAAAPPGGPLLPLDPAALPLRGLLLEPTLLLLLLAAALLLLAAVPLLALLEAASASQLDSACSTAAAARARASAFHRWLSSAGPGCATSSTVVARASRLLGSDGREVGTGGWDRKLGPRRSGSGGGGGGGGR